MSVDDTKGIMGMLQAMQRENQGLYERVSARMASMETELIRTREEMRTSIGDRHRESW